jgi:hypothetical protein
MHMTSIKKSSIAAMLLTGIAMLGLTGCPHRHHDDHHPPPPGVGDHHDDDHHDDHH